MHTFKLFSMDYNNVLNLSENQYFDLVKIEGLTEYKKTIYSSLVPHRPGSINTGHHIDPRDITITLKPVFNSISSIDDCYNQVCFFLAKANGNVIFEWKKGTELKKYHINAILDSISNPRFEKDCTITINLVCPYPFFEDTTTYQTRFYDGFYTRYIDNYGHDEIGGIFKVPISSDITKLEIENQTTGSKMILENLENVSGLQVGEIDITTIVGKESIKDYTTQADLISCFDFTSDWLKIVPGTNIVSISITADDSYSSDILFWHNEVYI